MKFIFLILPVLFLTSCIQDKDEAQENSKYTSFHYGDLYKVKEGFYKGFGCILLREYKNTVFCKISYFIKNDKQEIIQLEYQVRENFEKSNLEYIRVP